MILKKQMLLILLLSVAAPLLSNHYWPEPQHYIFQRGEEINIRFATGEGFSENNRNGSRSDITHLKLHFADAADDLISQLGHAPGDSLQFKIFEEGTAMISFIDSNRFSKLNTSEFNEKDTDSAYQLHMAKTIIQVGAKYTDQVLQPADLILDIIPLTHPFRFSQAGTITGKVLFMGSPMPGKKIRIWHRLLGGVTELTEVTDASGKFSFLLKPEGEWMISCVAAKTLENDAKSTWQHYHSTITWGYTRGRKTTEPFRGKP